TNDYPAVVLDLSARQVRIFARTCNVCWHFVPFRSPSDMHCPNSCCFHTGRLMDIACAVKAMCLYKSQLSVYQITVTLEFHLSGISGVPAEQFREFRRSSLSARRKPVNVRGIQIIGSRSPLISVR